MMTSIEEVNLRVSYQAQVCRQESKYFYTQLHDAKTDRRDIRLEVDVVRGQRTAYETELQKVHQAYLSSEARNRALLERLETLETNMSRMEWQHQSAEDLAVTQMMCIHALEARAQTDMVEDADSSSYTQRFQELALMCTKFLADETEKVDKYISELPDNIHGNVSSARPNTLDETIELANDLMDQKLRTNTKRFILGTYLCAPSAITITLGNVHPSVENARGHIKKNCPKLKNRGNDIGNGVAQRRAYALGGRDASMNSNVITAQEYLLKGCDVFLAHITMKEAKDKLEEKRLEDVPIIRDFLKVFPEDLPGIPPARQVEF
nr:putative reverse transcriptase domain-containing protein [Tanacetum cinerariifolium]